jgi:hypothetical protein
MIVFQKPVMMTGMMWKLHSGKEKRRLIVREAAVCDNP